jgi:hypothetical protein
MNNTTTTSHILKRKTCKPCLAALVTKERGRTLQLNNFRESLPPLHQYIVKPPVVFEDELDSISDCLALFLPMPCLEDARDELTTIWEADPIVTTESTCFNQSAESARSLKLDSNCIIQNYNVRH